MVDDLTLFQNVGMTVSFLFYLTQDREIVGLLRFSDNTFFFVCLPPIVFASGFNMQRGNFFSNIKNILLFGCITTFICFTIFSILTVEINEFKMMKQYSGKTGLWKDLEITTSECLLMCSLLCSSDVVAAISLISYDKQPKLFSIVFGEGIINDAVSIILFNTVQKYTKKTSIVTLTTPFSIAGNFVSLSLQSLFLGIIFALLSSYILKKFRAFSKNPVAECMIIFSFAYLSYLFSEVLKASGIISLLTCGVVMAHYSWYNLSPQGKQSSFIVFQFLGYATEAFVFSYLGLTFFSYGELDWSFHLFWVELFIIIVGRFIGVIGLMGLLKLCGY